MSSEGKSKAPWFWGAFFVLSGVVIAVLVASDRRREVSESFRYDLAEYAQVDPALVVFKETGRITPGLKELRALAVGPGQEIYVAGESAIAVYGPGGVEQRRLTVNGTPDCLAVAPDGEILLGLRTRVEVLDAQGALEAEWADLGEKAYLTSIAADDREVYVADAGNRVVLRFDRQGALLGRIGEKDEGREIPGFVVPSPSFDVAFDPDGGLWAVNPGRHGLERYRANGDLVTSWYRPSMDVDGFCGCCNPSHIAFRSDGSLVTAEKGLARVKLYSADWTLAGLVAAPDAFQDPLAGDVSDDLETHLKDLAVDAKNRVLVLDAKEHAVRIFEET